MKARKVRAEETTAAAAGTETPAAAVSAARVRQMEHRCGQRRHAEVGVTLSAPGKGILCPAKVLNLSSSGVAVQTNPSEWRPLDRVVVSFNPAGPAPYRVPATVARVTRDGVGLMFDVFDPGLERALTDNV